MKCLNYFRIVGLVAAFTASAARADIFQWEYINPADPGQGKQQSTTLAPDGAGVDAVPGANLGDRNLTMADLRAANLSGANGYITNLTKADLSQANLTNASFGYATLTEAEFSGAEIRGAHFEFDFQSGRGGITPEQIYSTASYHAHDLSGASFYANNLAGANFAGQTLRNVDFRYAPLAEADFTGAEVRGASFDRSYYGNGLTLEQLYSTTSYQHKDLSGIGLYANILTGVSFAGQNLSDANFLYASLTDAVFTNAEVQGASFSAPDFTLSQLYSTASYQARNLTGIQITGDLSGWNLTGQNLSRANFSDANLVRAAFATVNAPEARFERATLTNADFREANLTTADFLQATLTDADFRGAILANTNFERAALTGANFSGADIRGAVFTIDFEYHGIPPSDQYGTGITLTQLYSTASYQSRDLTGANFGYHDFTGGNFARQNLADVDFSNATLTNADFTDAEIPGAVFTSTFTLAQLYSTASYQAHDLNGVVVRYGNMTGGNFAGFNLKNADLSLAMLTNADLSGATIQGADLGNAITLTQLYSTASYHIGDLSGIGLGNNNLTGGNFAGQNLKNADFGTAILSGANLRHANLVNANFARGFFCSSEYSCFIPGFYYNYATLTHADLTAADARGAFGLNIVDATTANLVLPNGHIDGLDLEAGGLLVVHDYDGNPTPIGPFPFPFTGLHPSPIPPIPITVDEHLTMGPGGTLRMEFEADEWDSTISFAPGIPVTLGGTLELTFAPDVDLASQLGRTFDLFDWTGVNPTGAFAVSSPYTWSFSNLFTTGEVTLTAVPEPTSFAFVAIALVAFMPRSVHRFTALMKRRTHVLTKIISLTLVVAIQQSSSHASALRTVALSAQPASGTPSAVMFNNFGAHFLSIGEREVFRGPVINDSGRVAFRADLAGSGVDATNNQGVWSEGSGMLSLVARTGSAAPGGMNFGRNAALELFEPVLNDVGQTTFYGGLADGTVGLWLQSGGNLALVARDGMQAAGAPAGVNHSFALLRDLAPDLPKLNDAGQTAFWANLTGSGVDNTNNYGVWSGYSGSVALVARSGNPAPGTQTGVNFDSLLVQTGFNDAGQTAIFAFVTGSGVNPSNDQGIWSGSSGNLQLVVRTGTAAPGTFSGVNFRDFFPQVTINSLGRTAFGAWLTGDGIDGSNAEGIWAEGPGSLALVARSGSAAPGTAAGVQFDQFTFTGNSWPLLNDAGQTAFRANLTGTGVSSSNNRGIWIDSNDALELVARTGNAAPGTAANVRFADLSRPALNSEGQIAFRAFLTGSGVGSSNNLGIWATDQSGVLQLITRTGGQLEVSPGVLRTISDLGFVTDSGNGDGRASAFNDLGQLVFWARFTNGTQGVFVSNAVASLQMLPGDFDKNGVVDAADFVVWRHYLGTNFDLNFNGDEVGASAGVVDAADYALWRAHFGDSVGSGDVARKAAVVPEPQAVALSLIGLGAWMLGRRRMMVNARHCCHAVSIGKVIVLCVAVDLLSFASAHASTNDFDPNKKSPAVIPYDPHAVFEVQGDFLTGRVFPTVQGPWLGGTSVNALVGAGTFDSHGYTGTNAVIANIESGHIWSGHETLAHVLQIPNSASALNEFDRHATWNGMMLGGRQGGANPGEYQQGLAPGAQLYSGALASQWGGTRFTTGVSLFPIAAIFDQYRRAFSTGVNAAGRTADVINSSWGGFESGNGSGNMGTTFDGFANQNPRTLFVCAAGNSGPGPDTVGSPAAAYNNLSVAALGSNPPYDRPAFFSSGGPNDYVDPVNGTKDNARQVIDIAAPGENLSSAYYGGETGGNGTTDNPAVSGSGPTGLPSGPLGGPDYYSRGGGGGTSFAAPIVAGGAALLYDAAYSVLPSSADARDARVMKAVLMNSADKTVGWNNGQVAHPNGNGGVLTAQGLDNRVGTGQLNLHSAFDQFLTGTTDVADVTTGNLGLVDDIGWDYGQVASGTTNDYYFNSPLDGGSALTATLTWFRDRRINASNTIFDDSFDDLNLELWSVVDGTPTSLISESRSLYNESEHFSFALPATADYALRVRWFNEVFDRVSDANQELYGLAWWAGAGLQTAAVPEPASMVLLMMAATGWCLRRVRASTKYQQFVNV